MPSLAGRLLPSNVWDMSSESAVSLAMVSLARVWDNMVPVRLSPDMVASDDGSSSRVCSDRPRRRRAFLWVLGLFFSSSGRSCASAQLRRFSKRGMMLWSGSSWDTELKLRLCVQNAYLTLHYMYQTQGVGMAQYLKYGLWNGTTCTCTCTKYRIYVVVCVCVWGWISWLLTSQDHITDCKLNSVVHAGVGVVS